MTKSEMIARLKISHDSALLDIAKQLEHSVVIPEERFSVYYLEDTVNTRQDNREKVITAEFCPRASFHMPYDSTLNTEENMQKIQKLLKEDLINRLERPVYEDEETN